MGPHTTLLSLSTDGRISEAAWRAARAMDEAERANAPPPALPGPGVRVVAFNPKDVLKRSVRVIADAVAKRGQVVEADFIQAGVPLDLARRHWCEAVALARATDHAVDAALAS